MATYKTVDAVRAVVHEAIGYGDLLQSVEPPVETADSLTDPSKGVIGRKEA